MNTSSQTWTVPRHDECHNFPRPMTIPWQPMSDEAVQVQHKQSVIAVRWSPKHPIVIWLTIQNTLKYEIDLDTNQPAPKVPRSDVVTTKRKSVETIAQIFAIGLARGAFSASYCSRTRVLLGFIGVAKIASYGTGHIAVRSVQDDFQTAQHSLRDRVKGVTEAQDSPKIGPDRPKDWLKIAPRWVQVWSSCWIWWPRRGVHRYG